MRVKVRAAVAPQAQWAMGIDPSLTGFGVGFWHPEGHDFLTCRFVSKLKGVDRLIDIVCWLGATIDTITNSNVGMVCMEGYSYASQNSQAHSLGELGGAVKLELRRILPEPAAYPTTVPPTSLKKFTAGKGNVAKDQMMLAVFKKWGYEAPNSDQADAYALARLAACTIGSDQPRLAYEKEVVAGLERWTEAPKPPRNNSPRSQ